jgi:putative heme-binding domain-containing protein
MRSPCPSLRVTCVIATGLLLAPTGLRAQLSGSDDVAEGRQIFVRNCALCHGGDATGGRGPNLARGFFRRATTDARLLEIVQEGIAGTGMPGTGLSDTKAEQVTAYIRSLRGVEVELPGDPERGRELFFGAGTCSTCHMVFGEGSRQGPDLSWVGWLRAPDHLRQSILDPNAEVVPRWWSMEAIATNGARIAGILVDEDQFTVRVLDEMDALHSIAKRDLERFERVKISKMPAFQGTLTDEDIDDIVAYLAGLRGGTQ